MNSNSRLRKIQPVTVGTRRVLSASIATLTRPSSPSLPTVSGVALALAALFCGAAHGQNLVLNPDFSANAASFGTFPGYFGGANPGSATNWTGGSGINGTLAPGTGSPFAPAANVPSFLFMQGNLSASQALGTVNGTDYLFSFDAAARNGNTAGVSVFADNTQAASLILDGTGSNFGWLPTNAFQRYAFGFAATGAQTIQFNSSGVGDHTTDLTNVSVTAVAGAQYAIGDGTLFFTNTSGTNANGFALSGNNQTIYRRPGSATYTGNITTDGSGGALTFTANENLGANNLTFSGSTIALGAKNFVVTGQNVDSEGESANSKVTLNNAALTTGGNGEVGRGSLEITGSTSLNIGGQLKSGVGGDWARFVMNPGTAVTATGGVDFRANGVIASSMYLNGGTLTTPSITGNDFGGGHTVFNGTTIIASASNADFLDVHLNGNPAAHSAAALLGNGGAIFDTNGNNLTISNVLADLAGNNGSLTKQGNGTLSLTTANTFSGDTKVTAGTLGVGHDLALQNSALDTSGGGSVALTVTTPTLGGLKGGADLALVITSGYGSVSTLTLNPRSGLTATYAGVIANGAAGMALNKSGAGTQVLTGMNTYTGATTISAGTLQLQAGGAALLTDNFSATGNPNTLDLNFNLANRQTGSAALQSWTAAGNTQVGNPTAVQQPAGTNGDYLLLAFGASAALNGLPLSTANAPGPLKVSFDMFKGNTGNPSEWTSFTMRSAGGDGFPITGSGEFGFLYRANTGIQIFNNGGLLENLGATAGGDSFGFYLADSAGTGSPFAGNGTRLIVTQGGNVFGSYALNTGMGTSYLTFGSAGGMIGGVDNLAVNPFKTNVLDPATAVSLTASGATLQLDGVNQTVASLSGVGGSAVNLGPFSRLTVNGSTSTTFNGAISGTLASVVKDGPSVLELGAASTYTGGTTISGGTILAHHSAALSTGAVSVASGANYLAWWNTGSSVITNNFTLNGPGGNPGDGNKGAIYADGGVGGFAEYTLTGSVTLAATSTVGGNNSNNLRVLGQITGPGGLTKGSGRGDENSTLILGNTANDYAGNTVIANGAVKLAASEVIPHGLGKGSVTVNPGTTLDLGGFSETINSLSGAGTVTSTSSVGVPVSFTDDAGTGISNTKTYTHALDFAEGTDVAINGVNFNGAGLSGANWTLTGAGPTAGNGATGATGDISRLLTNFFYNGNPANLTLTGLTPGVTYETHLYERRWGGDRTQLFTINAGTGTGTTVFDEDASATPAYIPFRFTADASGTATITTNQIGAGSYHWYGATNEVVASPVLTVGDASSATFSGSLTGPLALTKIGAGLQTLAGASTFTGATTVSGGTLEAAATGALGGTGNLTINSSGTLLLSGAGTDRINDAATITMAGGTIAFSGNVTEGSSPGTGALTLTLSSIIDFAGGNSVINFGDSSAVMPMWAGGATLSIYNWDGSVTGGGNDQLKFGLANTALTSTQLSQISFFSGPGSGFLGTAVFVGSLGEVVPVPEPSSVALAMSLLGLIGWRERRKTRRTAGPSIRT